MKKSPLALVAALGIVLGVVTTTAITAVATNNTKPAPPRADGRSGAVVVAWNQELLHIVQTPGDQPANIHPTRSFAIMHAAIYDAVVSITRDDPRRQTEAGRHSGRCRRRRATGGRSCQRRLDSRSTPIRCWHPARRLP